MGRAGRDVMSWEAVGDGGGEGAGGFQIGTDTGYIKIQKKQQKAQFSIDLLEQVKEKERAKKQLESEEKELEWQEDEKVWRDQKELEDRYKAEEEKKVNKNRQFQ